MLQRLKGFHKPKGLECELETLTSTYGKFIAEPLERGFGQTLGNCLRRVLLSSIEGAAVMSIRVGSVFHEFSTIPGVKEDVTDLILNVKGLRVKMAVDGPRTLHLKATGPGEVRASQIAPEADVEVLTPNLYIATIDKDGQLQMEIEVGRGRGYASAERNKRENQPVDVIAVDSVFSPIVRVNYYVEDTRVGHATDYNRLILEVWTDGSILPKEAVVAAARILKEHLNIFSTFDEGEAEPERVADAEKERFVEYLSRSVDELELSVRSANCLKNSDIQYIWQLVQKSEAEMLKTKNFGRKSLNEIKEILVGMGLHFGMKLDDIPGGPWSSRKKPGED